MTRRAFGAAAAAGVGPLLGQKRKRPHMVMLLADDLGRYGGAYRGNGGMNAVVKTPAFDRMAQEGVTFTNAFMATPSCTPSRAAIATGCYSFRCGAAANLRGGDWKGVENPGQRLTGFGTLLGRSGYSVQGRFKTLQANWLGAKGRDGLGAFHRYSQFVSEAGSGGEQKARREKVYQQARESLRAALEQRGKDQPVFYVYGPINTHRPWVKGSGKRLWYIDPDSLQGKLPAFLPDVAEVREDVADYLGEVQAVDWILQGMLDELDAFAEKENTLLVVTGDNGMPGVPRGKCNLYDHGTAAPLWMRWPGRGKAGSRLEEFVNLMDLAPTFLEAGGVAAPAGINGRSLVRALEGKREGWDHVVLSRERHYPTARAGSLPYPSRAIRTRDFLYVRNFKPERWPMGDPGAGRYDAAKDQAELTYFKDMDFSPTKQWILEHQDGAGAEAYRLGFAKRPEEELYDLRKDRDQVVNVAGQAEYRGAQRMLKERLMKTLRENDDPRLTDAFDKAPYVEANAQ